MKNRLLQLIITSLKLSCYILILQVVFMTSLMAFDANAQLKSVKEVYISINFKNADVYEVFKEIESKTDFTFHFFKMDIKKNIRVDIKEESITVADVLYKISDVANLKFRQVNNNIAVSRIAGLSDRAKVVAQAIPVQGKVLDETGQPMAGVNVVIEGTTQGTITDIDGNYRLEATAGDILIFSFIGYQTIEMVIGNETTIDVQMEQDSKTLTEVIVRAYGTVKKGAFTGSSTQINAEALEGRALTNITSAIEGTSGVQFAPASGQPGDASPLRIRGTGSINASNDPLYVVDGIIFAGSLSSINPNDIESISVLKDAASTSLYGAKAANGVVILTTKSGSARDAKFTINISQGISERSIPEYDRVGPEEYYPLLWEARRNSLSISGNTPEADANQQASDEIFGLLGTNPFNVPNDQIVLPDGTLNPNAQLLYPDDLDWQDELTRGGNRTNVDLSYQGGTENTNYFVSLGYLDDQGWILNSDFERISGRVNLSTQPKDWIKTGLNLSATSSVSNQAADGGSTSFVNPFFSTRTIAPIYPIFEHDPVTGDFILDDAGNRIFDLGDNRVGNTNGRHAIQETILNVDRDRIFSLGARTFVDINFLKNFKFTFNASLDKRFFDTEDFENPIVGDGAPAGRASRTSRVRTVATYNQLLNYSRDFGEHSVSILLGHESQEFENRFVQGNRLSLALEGNTELVNFTQTTFLTSETAEYSNEGYFARAEYDYSDRYFISASFRRDGSSRFAPDARWGSFWSVGGAWRIDQEGFFRGVNLFSTLKLRASYGEVGNDSGFNSAVLSFFASQGLFNLAPNASESGINTASRSAEALGWETNKQSDVALEFTALNNRISGSIEYYNRVTEDLIFDVPLPLSTGFDEINQNIGTMFNRGVEISLTGDVYKTKDFRWTLNVNGSTIKNELTKLPDGQDEIIDFPQRLVVGNSIFDYYLRDYFGVDPADGAALYVLDPEEDVNDVSVRTVDGVLVTTNQNLANFTTQGSSLPDVFGSFTNTFIYKNFRLGFLFTYQIGGQTYDTNFANLMSSGNYGAALSTEILNRWQQPGDITNVPRLDQTQTAAFGAASTRWLVDSDFIALRQINFSYELPAKYISAIGFSNARVYANAENVFLSSKRTGLDVNQRFDGGTRNRFTPSRTITLGLTATF